MLPVVAVVIVSVEVLDLTVRIGKLRAVVVTETVAVVVTVVETNKVVCVTSFVVTIILSIVT